MTQAIKQWAEQNYQFNGKKITFFFKTRLQMIEFIKQQRMDETGAFFKNKEGMWEYSTQRLDWYFEDQLA